MERVTAAAPQNPITKYSLRQRAIIAARLLGTTIPFAQTHRLDTPLLSARDLVVWFMYQPLRDGKLPSCRQIAKLVGLKHCSIVRSIARTRHWTEGNAAESLITHRIMTGDISPIPVTQVLRFYRDLRLKPSKRGRKPGKSFTENYQQWQEDQRR